MSRDASSHEVFDNDASFIFDPNAFYKARFDAEDFIGSYVTHLHEHSAQKQAYDGPMTIKARHERLLSDLKRCEARLSAQFVELLNTEYASFIGLSQSLDGVLPAVEQISSRSEAIYARISRAQSAARAVLTRVKRTHVAASRHYAQTAYLAAADGLWAECDILDDILPIAVPSAVLPKTFATVTDHPSPASTFFSLGSTDGATSLLLASEAGCDMEADAFAAYLASASSPAPAPQCDPQASQGPLVFMPAASAAEAATASAMVLLQASYHLSRADTLAASAALSDSCGPASGEQLVQASPPALAAAVGAQRARLLAASERFHAAAADALACAIPALAEAWSPPAVSPAPLSGSAFELLRACRLLVTAFMSAPLPRSVSLSTPGTAPAFSRDLEDAQMRARVATRQAAVAHLIAAGLFRRPLREALRSVTSASTGGGSTDRLSVRSRFVDVLGTAADAVVSDATSSNGGRQCQALSDARATLVDVLVTAVGNAAPLLALLCTARETGRHGGVIDGDGAAPHAALPLQTVVSEGIWPEMLLALYFASGHSKIYAGAGSKSVFRSVWAAAHRPRAALAHFSVLRLLAAGLAAVSLSWQGSASEDSGARPAATELSSRLLVHPAAQSLVAGWGLRLAHSQSYSSAASQVEAASTSIVALSRTLSSAPVATLPETSAKELSVSLGSLTDGDWTSADTAAQVLFATASPSAATSTPYLLASTRTLAHLYKAALAPELVPPELAAAGVAAVATALSASSIALSAAATALPGAVLKSLSALDSSVPPPDLTLLSTIIADVSGTSTPANELYDCRVPIFLPAGAPLSTAVWRTALVGALSLCVNAQVISVDMPSALAGSSATAAVAAASSRLGDSLCPISAPESAQKAASAASTAVRDTVQRLTAVSRHRAAGAAWRSLVAVASAAAATVETAASAIVAEAMRSIRDRSGGARQTGAGAWVLTVTSFLDDVTAAATAAASSSSVSLRARAPFPMPPVDTPGAAAPETADLEAAFAPFFASLCHARNADGSAAASAQEAGDVNVTITSLCALNGGNGQAPGPTALALVLWLFARCLMHAVPAATARGIQSVLTLQASLSGPSSAQEALTLKFSSAGKACPPPMAVPRVGNASTVASQFISDVVLVQDSLSRAKDACTTLTESLDDSFGAELLNGLATQPWVSIA